MVQWVGLQCVTVVLPDHTHLLFGLNLHIHAYVLYASSKGKFVYLCTDYQDQTLQTTGSCVVDTKKNRLVVGIVAYLKQQIESRQAYTYLVRNLCDSEIGFKFNHEMS